jgi:hypothetical protein
MATFYVDETGYTGEDLINAAQPVFAQATNDFTDAETRSAIESIFSGVAATELKFTRLTRGGRNQDRIVELVRFTARDPARAGLWLAHKEFAMVTFIVDWWIEPLAYKGGLNLYEDGANLAMANMLFYTLEGFWGANFRRRLLMHFQRMMRVRTKEAFDECAAFVRRAYSKAHGSRTEVMRYLWTSFPLLGHRHVLGLPKHVLDLALPGLIFIGHTWRSRHSDPLEVVHDQSTNMAKQKWLWEALSSPTLAPATFPHRGGEHSFPINVVSIRFADSVQEKQLQLCDILAGAASSLVRAWNTESANSALNERLIDAGIEKLHIGGLWPSTDFTPEELGTKGLDSNRAIEWVAEQLRGIAKPSE